MNMRSRLLSLLPLAAAVVRGRQDLDTTALVQLPVAHSEQSQLSTELGREVGKELIFRYEVQTNYISTSSEPCLGTDFTGVKTKKDVGQRVEFSPMIHPCSNTLTVDGWSNPDVEMPFTPQLNEICAFNLTIRDDDKCIIRVACPSAPGQVSETPFWCKGFLATNYDARSWPKYEHKVRGAGRGSNLGQGRFFCINGTHRQHCARRLPYIFQDSLGNPLIPPVPNYNFVKCHGQGDVHYKSCKSGRKFDYQGSGAYVLARSSLLEVQGFNCPAATTRKVSMTAGVAVQARDASGVSYNITWVDDTVRINGNEITADGLSCLKDGIIGPSLHHRCIDDGAVTVEKSNHLTIQTPVTASGQATVKVVKKGLPEGRSFVGYVFQVSVFLPEASLANTVGLLMEDPQQKNLPSEAAAVWNLPKAGTLFFERDINNYLWNKCKCNQGTKCQPPPPDEEPLTVDEACSACDAAAVQQSKDCCGLLNATDPVAYSECMLDTCGLCEPERMCELAEEALQAEGETPPNMDTESEPSPSPSPQPNSGPSGAKGDPHCVNSRGEHFDIHATGDMTFVQVPRAGTTPGQDLLVIASIQPVNSHPCAPTVIQHLDIRGSWLGPKPPLSLSPGPDGVPQLPGAWKDGLAAQSNVSYKEVQAKPGAAKMLMIKVGNVFLQVNQRLGLKTGIKYFDLKVFGLGQLGEEAGGLLGVDDHSLEEKVADGCDPQAIVKLAREEGEEQGAGRLLSTAQSELSGEGGPRQFA